jgi:hypothetical protein
MSKRLNAVSCAVIAALCACSPAPTTPDVDPDAAVFEVPAAPMAAFCRTPSGRLFAVGEADAEAVSRLTIIADGRVATTDGAFSRTDDSIAVAGDGAEPVRMRLEPGVAVNGDWTPKVTAITGDGAAEDCLWRPRTRIVAMSETTALEAFRDEAGVLFLEVRDTKSTLQPRLSLSGGREETAEDSVTMVFDDAEARYIVHAPKGDTVRLARWRDGVRESVEALPILIVGDDPDALGNPLR